METVANDGIISATNLAAILRCAIFTYRQSAASRNASKRKDLTSNHDPTLLQIVTSTTEKLQDLACKKRLDLYNQVMRYSKPLNILVIGGAGAGKSSFINSCIRAIRKQAGQWVAVGYDEDVPNITSVLRRINMYFPNLDNPRMKQEGRHIDAPDAGPIAVEEAPSIIDICGMPDQNTELVRAVLRLLLYGHFELDKQNILDVQADIHPQHSLNLLHKYPRSNEDLVIHRVIVVANANGALPRELIKAVMETARPATHHKDRVISKRAVPVFGLMTKLDLVNTDDETFKERKSDFIKSLSLKGVARSVGMCRNYVSDEEQEEEDDDDPAIDEMILKFLCNVCDPTHHIHNPDWTLQTESLSTRIKATWERHRYYWVLGTVLIILCALCFTYLGTNTVYIPSLVFLLLCWFAKP